MQGKEIACAMVRPNRRQLFRLCQSDCHSQAGGAARLSQRAGSSRNPFHAGSGSAQPPVSPHCRFGEAFSVESVFEVAVVLGAAPAELSGTAALETAMICPPAEGDNDVLLLDGFDAAGIVPTFLNRDFYSAARRRPGPAGILVANFAGPQECWYKHFRLLNEAFEGRVHLETVSGVDNHIAFAFADVGYPFDWARLGEWAGALACQSSLDFPAPVNRLHDGVGL